MLISFSLFRSFLTDFFFTEKQDLLVVGQPYRLGFTTETLAYLADYYFFNDNVSILYICENYKQVDVNVEKFKKQLAQYYPDGKDIYGESAIIETSLDLSPFGKVLYVDSVYAGAVAFCHYGDDIDAIICKTLEQTNLDFVVFDKFLGEHGEKTTDLLATILEKDTKVLISTYDIYDSIFYKVKRDNKIIFYSTENQKYRNQNMIALQENPYGLGVVLGDFREYE